MSKPVIEVTDLSKKYVIKRKNKPDTLRDLLASNPLFGKGEPRTHKEDFWALKDINFSLNEGETLGVIGRNGAGKSTLLKILSQIVAPTTGRAVIRGKTASLLEVGTGFHQELTGRENVFFNGALLGMGRTEIARKFTDIVEFSEIGDFIDSPVKHYSSGMRSRLGFSVAAHLEADIMIIDEALSAGDVGFRKKALEKMKTAAFEGKSVLFVSHSMGSVEDLCDKALYLKKGEQIMIDDTKIVIDEYLEETKETVGTFWQRDKDTKIADSRITPARLAFIVDGAEHKKGRLVVDRKKTLEVQMAVDIQDPKPKAMSLGISIFDEQGRRILRLANSDVPVEKRPKLTKGLNELAIKLPTKIFRNGEYVVAMDCDIMKDKWVVHPGSTEARISFTLHDQDTLLTEWDIRKEAIIKPQTHVRHV